MSWVFLLKFCDFFKVAALFPRKSIHLANCNYFFFTWYLVSPLPSLEGKWGSKGVTTILQNRTFEDFFLEGGLRERGGLGFLEIAILRFTSWLLFYSLFMRRLKYVVSLFIFLLCLFDCTKFFVRFVLLIAYFSGRVEKVNVSDY